MHHTDLITNTFRLQKGQKDALKKLKLETLRDLLYHVPVRYEDFGQSTTITHMKAGEKVVLYGKLSGLKAKKAWKSKINMTEGWFEDSTGKIQVVWFHQPYIANMVTEGALVKVEGKVSERNGAFTLTNPDIEPATAIPEDATSLFGEDADEHRELNHIPVYSESRGITSRWFYYSIQKLLAADILETLDDPIPEEILKRYNLPTLQSALVWVHSPQKESHSTSARKRFAFEEIFFIQLQKQKDRAVLNAQPSWQIDPAPEHVQSFINRFSFTPTDAQSHAIEDILTDFKTPHAMSRLVEGDVGSGKTAVAAATVYAAVTTRPLNEGGGRQDFGNLQAAYMVPTEILAKQHFESFIEYFHHLPVQIGLITSSGCKKFPSKVDPTTWTDISRTQLLKWVKNGEIPILIGTHSLIQKTVEFKHLAYVIIDEQHRFGVQQRASLLARGLNAPACRQAETQHGLDADLPSRKQTKGKDPTQDSTLLYKDLTYALRRIMFEVKDELGLGHKERIYHKALEEAFTHNKIPFSTEHELPIYYRNKKVGTYRPDFVIDDKIIIELKALKFVGSQEKKQLWRYLKGSDYRLGLLVNFAPGTVTIDRVVYDTARKETSASSPHQSAPSPHLMSMTATPIPRTLALTIYGDLDLTVIDSMPPGRKPIITEVVPPSKREATYTKIKEALEEGRQVYVICPRIDEPDPKKAQAVQAKSVIAEQKRLQKDIFPDYTVGMLHGKMKSDEKEAVMKEFEEHTTDILVATSVVEVGVNVPNATVIIIEGAERFGLAQLHQLRGRVVRSTHQAYCYVFSDSKAKQTLDRLKALTKAKNGFELAEYDLQFRGAGELSGRRQSGISDLGMEAIRNIKMVEAARSEAQKLIAIDPDLTSLPLLQAELEVRGAIHFE